MTQIVASMGRSVDNTFYVNSSKGAACCGRAEDFARAVNRPARIIASRSEWKGVLEKGVSAKTNKIYVTSVEVEILSCLYPHEH